VWQILLGIEGGEKEPITFASRTDEFHNKYALRLLAEPASKPFQCAQMNITSLSLLCFWPDTKSPGQYRYLEPIQASF